MGVQPVTSFEHPMSFQQTNEMIPAYQPFNQSYEQNEHYWQSNQSSDQITENSMAPSYIESVTERDFQSTFGQESLKNQADSFFQQFEHEIASCLL